MLTGTEKHILISASKSILNELYTYPIETLLYKLSVFRLIFKCM